jgi:type II secretory pathway component PulJ
MMRRAPRMARVVRDARGFTVVEAVIALFLFGVIGMATLSLLFTQDRFHSRIEHTVNAEQSLRVAADLLSSEIRMSGPEDFIAASPDSVSVRFDVYQAVVCEVISAGQIAIFVYDSAPNPYVTTGAQGTAFKDPYDTSYETADAWVGGVSGSSGKSYCLAAGTPDTTLNLYRIVSGWPSAFAGATPQRGAIVRRYRQLTYRLAPSSLGNGYALYRGPQELVGPLHSSSSFSYVMDDGSVQTSVSGPSNLDDIRRVRFSLVAIDDDARFDVQRRLIMDIPLRN